MSDAFRKFEHEGWQNAIGRVAALWRFPVKSMRGERLERAEITPEGIVGDRAYALVDVETGKVVSAEKFRRYPNLFGFRARFAEPPRGGEPAPVVIVEMPGGGEVRSDFADADSLISSRLGREVRLVRHDAAEGGRNGDGLPFHDASPISVLTNSTLRRMSELQPGSEFDARRFRMNVILDCEEAGFPENAWVGCTLRIGAGIELAITRHDARCVMTTLAQDELPEDRAILMALAKFNRLQVGDRGRYPCAGVYARVLSEGSLATGDAVSLTEE